MNRIWAESGVCVQTYPFFCQAEIGRYTELWRIAWIYYDCSSGKGAVWGQSRIWITSMLIRSQRQPERDSRAWIPIHVSWIRTRTWLLVPVRRSGKVLKCTLEESLQASTPGVREMLSINSDSKREGKESNFK